ncbi:Temperature-sensitive hemagglutinin tsh autotransporter precursor [Klebsiella pneumoniae]|nr:Temperature-sensitive hemagglutinin tsh autotransporter precursor [Klebsiella pneumoniae]
MTTTNGSTWTGAGIIVDQNTSVNWQVNGVKGDNLHKIGQGTLIVQGTGVNEGGLKVGDGTVILNQQADSSGQVQAFSVNIASGRPTVVLADNRQVNPDNISWGYRGGILDVNGNDLSFHNISAADYGAQLHNSSDKEATVSLTIPDAIEWNGKDTQRISGQVYKYFNTESQTTEFFVLKTTSAGWSPSPAEKHLPEIFRGADYFSSQEEANREASADRQLIYHGKLTGNIRFDAGRVGKLLWMALLTSGGRSAKRTGV